MVAAELLLAKGHLKPVTVIIVQARIISFAVPLGSFYLNKRMKWGKWKQGVHFACRTAGYRHRISCVALDRQGRLQIGRNCTVWSKSWATQIADIDRRWNLHSPW